MIEFLCSIKGSYQPNPIDTKCAGFPAKWFQATWLIFIALCLVFIITNRVSTQAATKPMSDCLGQVEI